MQRLPFLPLSLIEKYLPIMRAQRVSIVARSSSGFLSAYRRAKGDPTKLSPAWLSKREAFIKRHMAQAMNRDEFLGTGEDVSRRHLALIAWAYSPNLKARRISAR